MLLPNLTTSFFEENGPTQGPLVMECEMLWRMVELGIEMGRKERRRS
jgi:hypothetical protein